VRIVDKDNGTATPIERSFEFKRLPDLWRRQPELPSQPLTVLCRNRIHIGFTRERCSLTVG